MQVARDPVVAGCWVAAERRRAQQRGRARDHPLRVPPRVDTCDAVRVVVVALLLLASAAAIAARAPDVFTRPQFWAEDGMVFYATAYNQPGPATLLTAYGGYLQSFARISGLLSQMVDFASAPLVMAVLALLAQMVAPVFLLSDRFAWVVPGRAQRLGLAALVLTAPNLMEVHVNVTNSHVHLAFLAFLVLLAAPRTSRAWRAFDVGVLVLSGVSGPFCVLLWPVAGLCWWRRRDRWSAIRLACVLGAALLQIAVMSPGIVLPGTGAHRGMASRRLRGPLGASIGNLLEIFGGQIVVGGLTGVRTYARLYAGAFAAHPWLPGLIGVAGIAFVARAAWVTSSFALRLLLLFGALHLAAGLASPIIISDAPLWELLQLPGAGQRYYYTMTIAFLATVVWTLAADPRVAIRVVAGGGFVLLVLVGIPGDLRIPPRADFDFPAQAERLAWSPPGTIVELRTPPDPFRMVLIRGCEPPHLPFRNDRQAHRLRSRRACPDR